MLWRWFQEYRETQRLERQLLNCRIARDASHLRSFRSSGASELSERDWDYEIVSAEESIDELKSNQIIFQAIKCDVPLPSRSADIDSDVNWGVGFNSGIVSLTREGRHAVRCAITQEKRERREWWAWWIPLLFGSIGAITGLVSAWRH